MKAFIKRLDDLWSLAVKLRAGSRCEMCFRTRALNSHHFFSRRYMGLRWDVENGFCLCADCHINTAHHRPSVFVLKAIKQRGEEWHNRLLLKTQQIYKYPDTALIEKELKEIIKAYS